MKFKHLTINYQLSTVNCQLSIMLLLFLFCALPLKSQVTIGNMNPPQPFSVLELSTKKINGGLRLPQLTTLEREALNSQLIVDDAAKGLVVYDTDLNCVEIWNGTEWISMCSDALVDCSSTVFPALNASYDFIAGATIDNLITAIGGNVQLYDAATGGNQYNPSTALNPALTYYVEQKIGVCTRRVPVAVTISTSPVIGSVAINACVSAMYDFQYQTLTAFGTGGGAATQWQWYAKRRGEADTQYQPIFGANAASYKIPANFVKDVFRKMKSGTDNNDSILFKVEVWNALNTPATRVSTTAITELDIEFIATNGNPKDGVTLSSNYNKDGSSNPSPSGDFKVAYLNLGVEPDVDGYNACDFGDLYQWGRWRDGHEKTTWTKVSFGNTIAFDATTQNNQTPTSGCTYNSTNPPAPEGDLPFYQVDNADYTGKFLTGSNSWNTVNSAYQYFWAAQTTYDKTANDPCPSGWHVPTRFELGALFRGTPASGSPGSTDKNKWTWRSDLGGMIAGGMIITYGDGSDKSKRVFMPAEGYRGTDGTLVIPGTNGSYWSSTYYDETRAYYLDFRSGNIGAGNAGDTKANGFCVRCVKEYASPPPPTLEVDKTSLMFTEAVDGGDQTVTVSTNQPTWTASSDQSWCSVSPASGTDGQPFTVSVTANSGTTTRTATITVTAGGLTKTVSVLQNGNVAAIVGGGTPPATNTSVGAFWKHNQTGERIIRITGIAAANAGAWTASVSWYDGQWNPNGGDGIVLSTDASADTNLGWLVGNDDNENVNMNTPADDATYSVSGGAPTVSGTITGAASDNTILFRIGLQQQFTAYKPDDDANPNPARYAVVLLSYANNTQVQKIFIRQGEGADYLPGSNNQGKRWSPYDLGNYGDPSLYNNGGFVAYPTQAGYLYQWGYSTSVNTPRLYPPVGTTLSPTWLSDSNNPLPTLGSVCPSGYTMPTAGSAGTDMSYFPPQDSTAWGYYADGFFDRRQIVSSPTGAASSTVSYNASILADNVAYIGKLLYNSTTNASLFLPAAGFRYYFDGTLGDAGGYGYYWSSIQLFSSSAYCLGVGSSTVNPAGTDGRAAGFSVRCVAE